MRYSVLSSSVIIAVLFIVGCTKPADLTETIPLATRAITTSIQTAPTDSSKEGVLAYEHLLNLANGIGNRQEGSAGATAAALYIYDALERMGYNPVHQYFRIQVKRDGKDVEVTSENIIAEKIGYGENTIIVGCHYDSVSIGTGADDNASAVGVMLELAERLKKVDTHCSIRFIAFGAEEDGFLGSTHYVSGLSSDNIISIANMINLDSLIAGNKMYVYGDFGVSGVLREAALQYSVENNLGLITQTGTKKYKAGTTGPFGDQVPFIEKGIPYTFFESTDWDVGKKDGYTQVAAKYGIKGKIWHTRFDTLAYITTTFPGRAENHLAVFVLVLMKIIPEFNPSF